MLSEGDICLVTAGEIAGLQVILEARIVPGGIYRYRGYDMLNTTKMPVWICHGLYNMKPYSVAEKYLVKLRGDENPTTELSDVQRSDTVEA